LRCGGRARRQALEALDDVVAAEHRRRRARTGGAVAFEGGGDLVGERPRRPHEVIPKA
jgi:hypothetical protein